MAARLTWSDPVPIARAPALPYLDRWLWDAGLDATPAETAADPAPCDPPAPAARRQSGKGEREAA